ncbi:transketolase [Achromatium sp. WMS3]|nr:transketolase [Achromatium sp. WMS3]
MEIVKRPHRTHFPAWAADKPKILVLSADLTSSCEADLFRNQHPQRFISMGMAEQNMMSWAGGLAREGFEPWIHTFAVFVCRRPFDQVAMSIGYPNLKVRLVGFLPGITTPGGVTHQAIDDIGLMRLIPNMCILVTGDATEVESVLDVAHTVNGPVYISMLRGEVPRLFTSPLKLGQARILSTGKDLAIISSGISTEEALRVQSCLKAKAVSVQHLHVSTIKPFTDPRIQDTIEQVRYGVITIENHSIIGGLGSAVAEVMATMGSSKRLIRLGIQDVYAHGASRPYLMRELGLDAMALINAVESLLGQELNIEAQDLAAVRIDAVHSEAKAEAL